MSVTNTSIEDLINGAGKNIDFASFLKTLAENPKKSSKKKKTKKETVCVEGEEAQDNIVVIDDSDKEEDVEETEEDSEEESEEETTDDSDEEDEDESGDMLFNVLSNFLVDEQGNNIATALTNISYELHKINSYLKTTSAST